MATLQGQSSSFGAELYSDFLLDNIQRFCLIGSDVFDDTSLTSILESSDLKYDDISGYNLFESLITVAGVDNHKQAYFNCVIPYDLNLGKFIHGVALIYDKDGTKEIVDWVKLNPFKQTTNIGGTIRYVTSATGGESGDIIFTNGDFISKDELDSVKVDVNNLNLSVSDNTNAINTNKDNITAVTDTANANKTDISNLTSTVSDNTNAINTNKDDITTVTNIANTNKTDISNLTSTVSDNTTAINTNKDNITTVTDTANTNKTDISNLNSTVSDNTSAINTNKTDISNLTSTVSDNTTAINTNKDNITTVTDTANTNKTDISNLNSTVSDNTSAINTNKDDISTLNSTVNSVRSVSDDNTAKINTLTDRVDQNDDELATHGAVIGSLVSWKNETPVGFSGNDFHQENTQDYGLYDVIVQDTEETDISNNYDKSTGTFIAPVSGYYFFSARVYVNAMYLEDEDEDDTGWSDDMGFAVAVYPDSGRDTADADFICDLRIGESEYKTAGSRKNASDQAFVYVKAGSEVVIQLVYWDEQPSGAKVNVSSTFSGFKVRV